MGFIGILFGVFVFLLLGSIKNKAHNQEGASKVFLGILISSILGFMIFAWNSYSLFSTLDSFQGGSTQNQQNNSQPKNQNNNQNNNSNGQGNGSDYFNF
ncbi:MAG: hypothetical protein ACRCXZ_06815 [Patescibacteria group bacterium]